MLSKADPDVAAAVFAEHLAAYWATGRPQQLGMERQDLDRLHSVVSLRATRQNVEADRYHLLLGAEYYDAWPPTVIFVRPEDWCEAKRTTRWFPKIPSPPAWFGLHESRQMDGYPAPRQLICFSFTAEFYMTGHNPTESQKWQQGRHTLAATLNRLQEVLSPPYYEGPTGT